MDLPLSPALWNQILLGDAKDLAKQVPDGSVDMVFSDPVYDRPEDYEWLAETAARVLKPNGSLFCFCRPRDQYPYRDLIEAKGLSFHWMIPYIVLGSGTRLFQYKLFNKYQPLLWFGLEGEKPSPRRFWIDYLQSANGRSSILPDVKTHKWSKHPDAIAQVLMAMTDPGEIVFDPFCGGATIPATAKALSRQYLGFESDEKTAETAIARVKATPIFEFLPSLDWSASLAAQSEIDFDDAGA